jgi:hypothetical protein
MLDERSHTLASRWISVVFLQGDPADELLRLIDRRGAAAAIEHLRPWDSGAEATEAALTNGYVYDRIPAGRTDRTFQDGTLHYALTYSVRFRYVSLLRRYPVEPDVELVSTRRMSVPQPARTRDPEHWVSARDRTSHNAGPAVAL